MMPCFIHAEFEVPAAVVGGELTCSEKGSSGDQGGASTPLSNVTTQCFDVSNCKAAFIGLPDGEEPSKPEPGDYRYSGMHDHGPLPPPKEGGVFAQIIGFVNAAKNASDTYLTELIEREKAAASSTTEGANKNGAKKRKIACDPL